MFDYNRILIVSFHVMKNLCVCLICIVCFCSAATAQEHTPQLLKEPADWEFERFALPPAFAPAITYKGAEELRFAPGMFKKDSANYFTYAFVVQLDNVSSISLNEIRHYLLNYYKGLCAITARDRKLVIDTTQITAVVEKKNTIPANETIYNASMNIFGVFADGAPVKLNLEVKVLEAAVNKLYLVVIASPLEKTAAVWKTLYQIQKEFKIPG